MTHCFSKIYDVLIQKGHFITYETLVQILKHNTWEEIHPYSLEMTNRLMVLSEICMFHLNRQTK